MNQKRKRNSNPNTKIQGTSSINSPSPKRKSSATGKSSIRSSTRSSTSSSKSYHCSGCNETFTGTFGSPTQFIRDHMSIRNPCKNAIVQCECCKKLFIDNYCFSAHISKAKPRCKKYYKDKASLNSIAKGFNKTQVTIPQMTYDLNAKKSATSSYRFNHLVVKKFTSSELKSLSTQHTMSQHIGDGFVNNETFDPNTDSGDVICTPCERENIIESPSNTNDQIAITEQSLLSIDNDQDQTQQSPSKSLSHNNNIFPEHEIFDRLEGTEIFTDTDENDTDISIDSENEDSSDLFVNVEHDASSLRTTTNVRTNNIAHSTTSIIHQTHLGINNEDHLLKITQCRDKELSLLHSDTQYEDSLELIMNLMKRKTTLSAYSDFMKWKYNGDTSQYYTLDKVTKVAEKRVYGKSFATKMKPRETNIICPSGRNVNLVTFDVDAAIIDLLSDNNITNPSSMIFDNGNEQNPFLVKEKDYYDDLDQSGIYQQTCKNLITDPSKELLAPLIVYMDETNLDTFSKLVLHPVVITLAIYNRATRNLSMAWRPIGYLPNFEEQFGHRKYSPLQKASDFHFCLRYMLDGIEQIQKLGGLFWDFEFPQYPGMKYRRLLKFTLSHVVSDAKENDMLTGRMNNRTSTRCLARDCDVTVEDSDNPNINCSFHSMVELEQKSDSELHQLSFRRVIPYLAFSNINMGSNPYGINGCTPCEPLHQINGGICERLPVTFLMRLSVLQVKILDSHVGFVCTHFSRHSDRTISKLNPFRNGLSSVSKLSADEKLSRILAIFLTLLTSDFEKEIVNQKGRQGREINSGSIITKDEYNLWIKVFQDTLTLTTWAYHTKHPKVAFNGGRNSIVAKRIRKFVSFYKQVADRKEGMGLKILKFHQLLHLWWVIRLFSSLSNVDSGRNESHHKKKKELGDKTQKRIEFFDVQTSSKEYTHDLFLKAMKKSNVKIPDMFEMKVTSKNVTDNGNNNNTRRCGSKFLLTFDYENKCVNPHWLSRSMKKKPCCFPINILRAIYTKFDGYNHGKIGFRMKHIKCFTEYMIKDNNEESIIRACPNFRSERDWFDWVVVDWGSLYQELEAQVLIFMDIESIILEKYSPSITLTGMNIEHDLIEHELVALVHSCKFSETNHYRRRSVSGSGYITNTLCHFRNMEDTYQLVSVEAIVGTCAVVVDSAQNNYPTFTPGMAKEVFVVDYQFNWHLHFIDYENKDLLRTGNDAVDDEYPLGHDRHYYEG